MSAALFPFMPLLLAQLLLLFSPSCNALLAQARPTMKRILLVIIIGARCARPTLVDKTKICLYIYIYIFIYLYIYMVRAYSVYIYILPHLCAMQYFHIACWFM